MKRDAGFTLLEVLVALTVLAIGTALTLSLVSGSLGNIRKVRERARAVEHAKTVMELALLDDSIKGATTLGDTFEDGTRWTVTVSEVEMPLPASTMPGIRPGQLTFKLLAYLVEVSEPEGAEPVFQLQTMKLVNTGETGVPGRGGQQ